MAIPGGPRNLFRNTVCCIAAILLVQGTARSQTTYHRFSVSLGLGTEVPMFNESFRVYWRNAGLYAVNSQVRLSREVVFSVRINLHRFQFNQDQLEEDFKSSSPGSGGQLTLERGQRNTLECGASLMFYLTRPTDPVGFYFPFGGSYYFFRYEPVRAVFEKGDETIDYTLRKKVNFHGYGPHGGFGLDFTISDLFYFFTEARLHYLFISLAPDHGKIGKVERVIFDDSKNILFISVLWGLRVDL